MSNRQNLDINFDNNEKEKNLLLHILKTNKKIFKQQQLVNRYQLYCLKNKKN